jgi:hypothetical protein
LQELRRGSLTEQFLMVKRKDGARVQRDPYPLLTRKQGRKTRSQRLTDPALAQILWGQEAKAPKAWRDCLEAGDIIRLLRPAGKKLPSSAPSKKSMLTQLGACENNAPQMRYAEYRQKRFFVGSGGARPTAVRLSVSA